MLQENPRRDLNALPGNRQALAEMPEGRFVSEAYQHGRTSPSLACVDYEDLLPRPISEARQRVGLRTLEEAHPTGIPARGWLLDRIERNVALV